MSHLCRCHVLIATVAPCGFAIYDAWRHLYQVFELFCFWLRRLQVTSACKQRYLSLPLSKFIFTIKAPCLELLDVPRPFWFPSSSPGRHLQSYNVPPSGHEPTVSWNNDPFKAGKLMKTITACGPFPILPLFPQTTHWGDAKYVGLTILTHPSTQYYY